MNSSVNRLIQKLSLDLFLYTYEKDDTHDLSNVEAFLELKDGKLIPTAITVQSCYPGSFAPHSPLKDPA